jgi:hypothetical protein
MTSQKFDPKSKGIKQAQSTTTININEHNQKARAFQAISNAPIRSTRSCQGRS